MTRLIGNAWLAEHFDCGDVPLRQHSCLSGVRFEREDASGGVERGFPSSYAVADDVFAHLVFALKHESPELELLSRVLGTLAPESLVGFISRQASGRYARLLGSPWPAIGGLKWGPPSREVRLNSCGAPWVISMHGRPVPPF